MDKCHFCGLSLYSKARGKHRVQLKKRTNKSWKQQYTSVWMCTDCRNKYLEDIRLNKQKKK